MINLPKEQQAECASVHAPGSEPPPDVTDSPPEATLNAFAMSIDESIEGLNGLMKRMQVRIAEAIDTDPANVGTLGRVSKAVTDYVSVVRQYASLGSLLLRMEASKDGGRR